jgi:hypothetical protein
MDASKEFSTLATLHRGFSYMPGELKLSNGYLSFTAHGPGEFWTYQLRALEHEAHQPGLAQKVANGEAVKVFDAPLREVSVNFNRLGAMKLVVGNLNCRIGFYDVALVKEIPKLSDSPIGAAKGLFKGLRVLPKTLSESSTALERARVWKALLAPQSKG